MISICNRYYNFLLFLMSVDAEINSKEKHMDAEILPNKDNLPPSASPCFQLTMILLFCKLL